MATTESRSGFRLPWSSDQSTSPEPSATSETEAVAVMGAESKPTVSEPTASEPTASEPTASEPTASEPTVDSVDAPAGPAEGSSVTSTQGQATEAPDAGPGANRAASDTKTPAPGGRRPVKFLADLAKAMQAAAESARSATVEQYRADGKAFVEGIHGRSAEESASIRRRADEDVAAIRDWSKAEIARIREEADQRTGRRKAHLETQLERHAALIEREIEKVQGRISEFEQEMEQFFDALLREEDPTKIAALAASLPEPEPFEAIDDQALEELLADSELVPVAGSAHTLEEAIDAMPEPEAAVITEGATTPEAQRAESESMIAQVDGSAVDGAGADSATAEATTSDQAGSWSEAGDAEPEDHAVTAEEAMAAIEARARAAELAEAEAEAEASVEATSAEHAEQVSPANEEPADPDSIVEIGEASLAARLAGLVPTTAPAQAQAAASTTTQVVVVGLVSVASIAGFKRQLGRVTGVQSVGVSSGPDGEFVFAVAHGPDQHLADQVASLPGFQATITNSSAGVINVTAHDPEA